MRVGHSRPAPRPRTFVHSVGQIENREFSSSTARAMPFSQTAANQPLSGDRSEPQAGRVPQHCCLHSRILRLVFHHHSELETRGYTAHTHTHTHTECAQRRQATRTGSVEVFLTCQTPETNPRVASDPIGSSHSVPGDRKFHFDLLCLAARRRRPHSQLTWAARICLLAPANQVSSSQRQNLLPPACRR